MNQRSGLLTNMMKSKVLLGKYHQLDSSGGNTRYCHRLWYEALSEKACMFWHSLMDKASQKKEYRWEEFLADPDDPKKFSPVKSIRGFSSIANQVRTLSSQLRKKNPILGGCLELAMALDPTSYAESSHAKESETGAIALRKEFRRNLQQNQS